MAQLSVLVVEDSLVQRTALAEMCLELGAGDVAVADNGRTALKAIDGRAEEFDLLICDLEMPDMNGIELVDLLAARSTGSGLIILSGREESLIYAVGLMASRRGLRVLGSVKKPMTRDALTKIFSDCRAQQDQSSALSASKPSRPVTLQRLQHAIGQRELVLHYQPKMNLADMSLHGIEALVRIQEEDGSLIYPDRFIAVSEQEGLIDYLSLEVLRLALEQKNRWNSQGLNTVISINLSAASFQNNIFCDAVLDNIRAMEADAKNIIFEVTETAVIQDMTRALAVLTRLRLAGCGLSLDDYGTGYSSVKQLSQIPFTELKVDRSLIDGIAGKGHLQVIFENTLKMCNELGITLVAEGIEQPADLDFLYRSGCPVGQGYLFSPPIAESDFIHWYQAGMPTLNH